MAKVWKREWTRADGKKSSRWMVDYFDSTRHRRYKAFKLKRDADTYLTKVMGEVASGTHTAPSQSITVAEAATNWLDHVEAQGRERSTLAQYRQHVNLHIIPRIGNEKLATLTTSRVQKLVDGWLKDLPSKATAKKVLVSFKSLLTEAQRQNNVAQNVAAVVKIKTNKRDKRKLKVGIDIPTRQETKQIIDAAGEGRARALLMTAAFAGLRASELRGLRWADVNLEDGKISVTQRADRFNTIGRPKSDAGERTIPIASMLVNALKTWKLQCPHSELNLVFPTPRGNIEHHKNMLKGAGRIQIKAVLTDTAGKPKYDLHSLRHFYASWCINRRRDGGLELPAKVVQDRLGHSSITMTMDLYGHLFPSDDDGAELDAGMQAIFAT